MVSKGTSETDYRTNRHRERETPRTYSSGSQAQVVPRTERSGVPEAPVGQTYVTEASAEREREGDGWRGGDGGRGIDGGGGGEGQRGMDGGGGR